MAEAGKVIALVGVLGAGGFVAFQYMNYSEAMNQINLRDPTGATGQAVNQALGFGGYLMAVFGAPPQGTPAGNAYLLLQAALSGSLSAQLAPAPGTSASTGQPVTTTVSTAPPTTPTTNPAPPSPPLPTASDLTNALNTNAATADQWNFAFRQLTGFGIENVFGGNFDSIYGPISSAGTRSSGQMTAQAFLNLPVSEGIKSSGMGAIARFYTPVINSMGSMVYRAQHPSPYRLPIGGGMGALTQASGFEKALWAGGFIRNRMVL